MIRCQDVGVARELDQLLVGLSDYFWVGPDCFSKNSLDNDTSSVLRVKRRGKLDTVHC